MDILESVGTPFETGEIDLDLFPTANQLAGAAPLCYGFQIVADPRDRGEYPLQVKLTGIGNQGTAFMYVTSPQWHYGRFAKVEIVSQGSTVNQGQWFCTFAKHRDAKVYPVSPPSVAADFPAASGGSPSAPAEFAPTANLDDSGTPPTSSTDGISIAGKSTFMVTVDTGSAQTVTGGGVDVYRYDGIRWALILQNVTLPTGKSAVAAPLDRTLLQGAGYRLAVRTNAITLSGAQADVTVSILVQ